MGRDFVVDRSMVSECAGLGDGHFRPEYCGSPLPFSNTLPPFFVAEGRWIALLSMGVVEDVSRLYGGQGCETKENS